MYCIIGEKTEIGRSLDLVKKIFQRKMDSFLEELDNEIDGVRVIQLSSNGAREVEIYSLSFDISDLDTKMDKIREYVAENSRIVK